MNKSKIYTAIYYASIIFALVYLFKIDSLNFSKLGLNINIIISLGFLTLGFFTYSLVLKMVLKYQNIDASLKTCFTAIGSTIFSKYIPGKVAMIYAIAYKLNIHTDNLNIKRLSYNVLLFQILILLSGFISGLFFVFQMNDIPSYWKFGSVSLILISVIILQSKTFFKFLAKMVSAKLKKDIVMLHFSRGSVLAILFTSILFWLFWGIGLYLFINSLGISLHNQFAIIFLFPFSICVGILAIIAPGGIGIREGALALFIVSLGNPISIASEISILSRLWFIMGEIILFFISTTIPYLYKQYLSRSK